tara:strand:+ start:1187 stop:2122 length:936 start_codon:yes stop_codon:yes gene_type:complete
MDDTIETADATEPTQTEVENQTQPDLAQLFEPKSEQTETDSTDLEATEEVEEEYAEEEEVTDSYEEEDVLSQSDEETEEVKPLDKGKQKMLRQISKLTARAKNAEEELVRVKAERQKQAVESNDLAGIDTLEGLEEYKQTAIRAKQFAVKNLGKDYVEHNGEEYDSERISAVFQQADEALTVAIPKREKHILMKANIEANLPNHFPWMQDEDSPIQQLYTRGKAMPELQAIHGMANAEMIFGYLAEGVLAVEHKAQLAKKAKRPKKAKPPRAVAPSTAPRPSKPKDRSAMLGKGNIDIQTFSQFLDNKEEN